MKHNQVKDLHTKTKDELMKLLKDIQHEVFTMRLDNTRQKLKNTGSLFHKKKDVARILTIIREKEFTKNG